MEEVSSSLNENINENASATKCIDESLLREDQYAENIDLNVPEFGCTELNFPTVLPNDLESCLNDENKKLNNGSTDIDVQIDSYDTNLLTSVNSCEQINDVETVSSSILFKALANAASSEVENTNEDITDISEVVNPAQENNATANTNVVENVTLENNMAGNSGVQNEHSNTVSDISEVESTTRENNLFGDDKNRQSSVPNGAFSLIEESRKNGVNNKVSSSNFIDITNSNSNDSNTLSADSNGIESMQIVENADSSVSDNISQGDPDENPLKSCDEDEEETISVHSSTTSGEVNEPTLLLDNSSIDIYDSGDDASDDILHMEPQVELIISNETLNNGSTVKTAPIRGETEKENIDDDVANNCEEISIPSVQTSNGGDICESKQMDSENKENNEKSSKLGKLRVRDICKQKGDFVSPVDEESIVENGGRPQRQAAKKAESQIRVLASGNESISRTMEIVKSLTDPVSRTCFFCRRVRFCNHIGTTNKLSVFICNGCYSTKTKNQLPTMTISTVATSCSTDVVTVSASPATTTTPLPIASISGGGQHSITKSNVPFKPHYIHFKRKCRHCNLRNIVDTKSLSWELMDFCNEDCLGRYQMLLASSCANCKGAVHQSSMGKYCVRFGLDIRQFCSGICLEDFKINLKTCGYCQKDTTLISTVFSAAIGENNQPKDFCSERCMKKFQKIHSTDKEPVTEYGTCSVCRNNKPVQVEMIFDSNDHQLCSDVCLSAFKFANHIESTEKCDICKKIFDDSPSNTLFAYDDDKPFNFCSKMCLNAYILAKRRIVPCNWCKVKKYNFDMIKKTTADGGSLEMCSLNCLTLYQVSVNASSTRKIKCDHCKVVEFAQYHLTMSDATIRNFCSYNCVVNFQARFGKTPILITDNHSSSAPVPLGAPKRVVFSSKSADGVTSSSPAIIDITSNPTNVETNPSLTNMTNTLIVTTSDRVTTIDNSTSSLSPVTSSSHSTTVKTEKWLQQILLPVPNCPGDYRNKMIQTRQDTDTKSTSCELFTADKQMQTEESTVSSSTKIPIIVPVPIYVPVPVPMSQSPCIMPVPLIIPLPIPVFLPSTKKTFKKILKEMEAIRLRTLNTALREDVSEKTEREEEERKSSSDDGNLREENPLDHAKVQLLENSVNESTTDTDSDSSSSSSSSSSLPSTSLSSHEEDKITAVITKANFDDVLNGETKLNNGLVADEKTSLSFSKKRKKISESEDDDGESVKKQRNLSPTEQEAVEVLNNECVDEDNANTELPQSVCIPYALLKIDVGLSAWNNWITVKKEQLSSNKWDVENGVELLEKSLLKLTADELNFMLSLFVGEISKPNGISYDPDHLFYLCLCLQQYLHVNGRHDNIFMDSLYSLFTDTLNEKILNRANDDSIQLHNDSIMDGCISYSCQVEEEHLWECRQLGVHSPHVLLGTVLYFNTKHLKLSTIEDHMQLSFTNIVKQCDEAYSAEKSISDAECESNYIDYEEIFKLGGQLAKCPLKLYNFYLSKCPSSMKQNEDVFYLQPETSCLSNSTVWFSSTPMSKDSLKKILNRVKLVKEIKLSFINRELAS